jgi:phosphopantetheine--protein transferase-like protein
MSVIGVGVDAIEVQRVRVAVARTPRLVARLFTEQERAVCTSRCGDLKTGGLAARFAAKEAVAKSLGTGIAGFGFRDVEVVPDVRGKPEVSLHGGAADIAAGLGVTNVELSLTVSVEVAIANVVAEGAS